MKNDPLASNGRILIVDDEPGILSLLKDLLTAFEYSPVSFADPIQALDLFKKEHESFDIVLTDLSMPTMSGVQLAQQMYETSPSTPIIILTGFGESLAEELLQHEYISGVLNKPMTPGELLQVIQGAKVESRTVLA